MRVHARSVQSKSSGLGPGSLMGHSHSPAFRRMSMAICVGPRISRGTHEDLHDVSTRPFFQKAPNQLVPKHSPLGFRPGELGGPYSLARRTTPRITDGVGHQVSYQDLEKNGPSIRMQRAFPANGPARELRLGGGTVK